MNIIKIKKNVRKEKCKKYAMCIYIWNFGFMREKEENIKYDNNYINEILK